VGGENPMANMAKQDIELQRFQVHISREFEDIKRLKSFPNKYNRFPISNSISLRPEGFGMIPVQQIPETLRAYEGRVKALEKELNARENETIKLNDIIRLLMEENSYLKVHIEKKTSDFTRAFQTLHLNDSEIVNDLNHKLKLYDDENKLLMSYIDELKGLKSSSEKKAGDIGHEHDKLSLEHKNIRTNLNEALAREAGLTHENQINNIKLTKANEKIKELEKDLKQANDKIDKLEDKQALDANSQKAHKRQVEDKEQKNLIEIHELTQNNASLQNENAELNKIVQSQQKTLEDNKKEMKKLRRDIEHIKLEDEDYLQRMQNSKNEVAHMLNEKEAAVKNSKYYEEKALNLEEQIKELKQSLEVAQENYINTSASLEELRKQYNLKTSSYTQQLSEIKDKSRETTNERDEAILSLYDRIDRIERDLALSADPLRIPESTKRELQRVKTDINKYLPKEESVNSTPIFKPNYDLLATQKPVRSAVSDAASQIRNEDYADIYAKDSKSTYDTSIPITAESVIKEYRTARDTADSFYKNSPISTNRFYEKNTTESSNSKLSTLGSPQQDYPSGQKKHWNSHEVQEIIDGVLKRNKSVEPNKYYEGSGSSNRLLTESGSVKSILKSPQTTSKYSPIYTQSPYSYSTNNLRLNSYVSFLDKI